MINKEKYVLLILHPLQARVKEPIAEPRRAKPKTKTYVSKSSECRSSLRLSYRQMKNKTKGEGNDNKYTFKGSISVNAVWPPF